MDIYPDVFHELTNGGNIENIHDYAEFRINNLDKAIILNPGARHDLSSETEVCVKVLSEKYAYKTVETALLLSNVIDANHQNSCLFTISITFMGFNWCSS